MKKYIHTNSFILHVIAMTSMLIDHTWKVMILDSNWMICAGRIAFPVFAFLIVEGYFHTKDLRAYLKRLFQFALISEIPYNLMAGAFIDPFHQNVIWTFLISLMIISVIEKTKEKNNHTLTILVSVLLTVSGYFAGLFSMVDYGQFGVLTVLAFYFFRGNQWYFKVLQTIGIVSIHGFMIHGLGFDLSLFGREIFIGAQTFAILALIPIFLYNGEQGLYNKKIQKIYYWFYPVHMLILTILSAIFYHS